MSTFDEPHVSDPGMRCAICDTLNDSERITCIGCGTSLIEIAVSAETTTHPQLKERKAVKNPILKLAAILIATASLWMAFVIFRNPQAFAVVPDDKTPTLLPSAQPAASTATPTLIPTPTAVALRSPTPTSAPTQTPTPQPTPTLQPPLEHIIQPGEALYNLALRYSVSIDSIININPGLSPDSITSGQAIAVPLPTATPPLEPVAITFNGETAIADPTDCIQHEIQDGDSYFAIASRYNINIDAILEMNRLTEADLLRPGDRVCIPTIVYGVAALNADGVVSLDRTPNNIVSPRLLYPAPAATVSRGVDGVTVGLTLQWVAERDLAPNEWYMVEITNLSDATSRPRRVFTRQTSAQLTEQQLLSAGFEQQYRWRVSYVIATDAPDAAAFSYAFNGTSSESTFTLK